MYNHEIDEANRAAMLDWSLQVFRVINASGPQTFYLAAEIMDAYFSAKHQSKVSLTFSNLYLIGLVTIFLASKYEDILHISMKEIKEDAGHSKFTLE